MQSIKKIQDPDHHQKKRIIKKYKSVNNFSSFPVNQRINKLTNQKHNLGGGKRKTNNENNKSSRNNNEHNDNRYSKK